MQYTHDISQANDYAKEALARMKREGLPPTPDIYELWYIYYSGQSPEVNKAIDTFVAARQPLSEERCKELYQRYLSDDRNEEKIRRAGDQIHATIQNVTDVVRDVKSATAEYSDRLGGVTTKIVDIKDPGELKRILTAVVSDTKTMLAQNQRLEEQLDKSSHVMEELQRDLENVKREALTDGLTGLGNRKAFDSEIQRIASEAELSGVPYTLLMMDIDHFKSFNDNYGHQIGDQVLRLVAKTMTDGVKGRDIATRYGGEEFAIILPDTSLQAGVLVSNALRKAIASKDVINRNSGEKLGRITMSIGVAESIQGESINDLIARADEALYTAKHNGRNQVAAAPSPGRTKKE